MKFAPICRCAVGELGDEFPEIVQKVLYEFGIDSSKLNEPRIRLLTEAFTKWDKAVSKDRGRPVGILAENNDLMMSPESHWQDLDDKTESLIVEALLIAFTSQDKFEAFLSNKLDVSLSRITSPNNTLRTMFFYVVRLFRKRSQLGKFMNSVKLEFPDIQTIQQLVNEIVGDGANYRSAWESFVRRLADGKRVGIKKLIHNSIEQFGMPGDAATKFVSFFALPDESTALAPAYTELLGFLDDKSLDLLAQRIVGIDLIDRSNKAKTLLLEAYEIGRFQDLIDAVRKQIRLKMHSKVDNKIESSERLKHIDIASEGEAWRTLLKSLMDALPSPIDLERVLLSLDDKLANYIDMASEIYDQSIERIIRKYNDTYRIDDLVRAAITERPDNGFLRAFALERGIEMQIPSTQSDLVPVGESLERMLDSHRGFRNPMDLIRKMGSIVNAVCRINVGGKAMGTGFLIGPNTVMTTYHLLETVIKDNNHEVVKIRFDYKTAEKSGEPKPGITYSLEKENWLVDCSAYDPNDSAFNLRDETIAFERAQDCLDYAVVRTVGRPTDDMVGEPPVKRGFLKIPETGPNHREVFGKDSGIFIFQHPLGKPLRVDFTQNAEFAMDQNQMRVIYDANTQPGTAGSPCFSLRLELIAMHESRGTVQNEDSTNFYKQGIPIDKIRKLLKNRGKWDEIYT